jgi:hypothetical protein
MELSHSWESSFVPRGFGTVDSAQEFQARWPRWAMIASALSPPVALNSGTCLARAEGFRMLAMSLPLLGDAVRQTEAVSQRLPIAKPPRA